MENHFGFDEEVRVLCERALSFLFPLIDRPLRIETVFEGCDLEHSRAQSEVTFLTIMSH